ncbi:MAG: Outer membrane protein TolC precursor [Syntrophorhabdus sp. PtaU1.Bin058]|nr:MAG: Outer membrane protein TolC precursor [Syntrophorhabdus sp. PtaU1.Bin058]
MIINEFVMGPMKYCTCFVVFIVFIISSPVFADGPVVKAGESLSLERCIEIALAQHPSIMSSRYTVRAKESLLGQAKAPYYPKVDTQAGFNRYVVEKNTYDPWFPAGLHNENIGSATLSQTIYDFGKTPTDVKTKEFDVDSSRFDLEDVTTTVISNLKTSYYGVLKAKRSRDVNLEIVEQYKEHLGQAKILFEAGKKPKYDVTKAELDLSNARLDLITAENDLKVAWVKLYNAMGIGTTDQFTINDNLSFEEYAVTLEDALDRAYQQRPDLRSLAAQKNSAEASVDRAKRDYYPTISGNARYNFQGSQYPLGQVWNAGVSMNMNIFEGMLTRNKIEESLARTRSVEAQIEAKRLNILLDVKQSYLNLLKAKETISNTEVQIRQATENLELANLRYSAGLADPLEVTDATVSYSKAKLANISALYDYKTAQADIERAMGKR